jgi:DNA polymerase-1
MVFDGLAFRTLWDRLVELGGQAAAAAESIDVEVTTAVDLAGVEALPPGPVVVELVTDGFELAGVMCASSDAAALFVPLESLSILDARLKADGMVAHDAKRVLGALIEAETGPYRVAFDTALAAYVINPAQRAPDLEELAYRELGLTVEAAQDDGEGAPQASFDFSGRQGPDLESAARRAVTVARLVPALRQQVEARGSTALLEDIELPLIPILARMEVTGIAVDAEFLTDLGDDLRKRLGELETAIHEAAGEPFNINSTLQLREVLFDRLGLPVLAKTPKGQPSTDASVLGKLRDEHPVVENLLRYRELEKLRSTYVDALLPLIEEDGRIRGRFNQMAAATGRLSQEQPNLQNIPIRSEEGRVIRKAFVAEEGCVFLVADYSQIELRILAHMSGDRGLVDAFEHDLDIHTATAARVGGVSLAEVDPDARRRAKMINFGLLYGMEAFGLAQRLEISREEAAAHVEQYFAQFPEVRAFMRGIVADARATGFTTTLLGRRRYLPELASSNFRDRQMGERMALNAPIQGSAADIIKKAMVELDEALRAGGYRAEMLLQVHDELVLEVPEDEIEAVTELTKRTMEGIVELRVPLRVDTAIGRSLADTKS